jgi:NTP pyrophosphatase (non-canonical NTP hydrolase)
MTNDERLRVLVEEVGEVAKAIDTLAAGPWDPNPDPDCMSELEQALSLVADLRVELVQVAAVAVAWVEGLDAERAA